MHDRDNERKLNPEWRKGVTLYAPAILWQGHKNVCETWMFLTATKNKGTYKDKIYTSPQLFGKFFNFRIYIKIFIYAVKKTSKF